MSKPTPSQFWLEKIYDTTLPGSTKAVAAFLASRMYGSKDWASTSVATIVQQSGFSESTVQRAKKQLKQAGWISERLTKEFKAPVLTAITPVTVTPPTVTPLHSDTPSQGHPPPVTVTPESVTESVSTSSTRFKPPTLDELTEYCQEKGHTFDPEKFMAHYESVGWKVGRNPMKNWKAATTTWQKRENPNEKTNGYTKPHQDTRRLSAGDRVRAKAAERAREREREAAAVVGRTS